jgi:hypothetical protein
MPRVLDPFRFVLVAVAGWMNQRQLQVIDYLREQNRVLREQLGGRRVRLDDNQRRRLAERFVRSIKESCLERMIFFGEESLRTAIHQFVAHYHSERNHQGLANQLISPEAGHLGNAGEVQRRQRLGGLLNYYYRAAA